MLEKERREGGRRHCGPKHFSSCLALTQLSSRVFLIGQHFPYQLTFSLSTHTLVIS